MIPKSFRVHRRIKQKVATGEEVGKLGNQSLDRKECEETSPVPVV